MDVRDFLGRPIREGDRVVFIDHSSTSSNFKSGVVIKTNPKTVEIESERGHKTRKEGYKVIVQFAADVVPVVRCKDCIYWRGDRVSGNCIADGLKTRFASDYCSKAVRKSDNSDHCVCCGDVIPEGRQVCSACEGGGEIADRSD